VPKLNTSATVETSLDAHHAHWAKLRRDLHAHPELRFEERRTADVVARELESLGYAVLRGLGGTGVVGSLPGADPGRGIVLRADLDALPIQEANDFAHASCANGVMHACGHDGHTVMPAETALCETVIRETFGSERLDNHIPSNMTSEDFGFMLEERPGAYVLIGNAPPGAAARSLHHPKYDDIIPAGVRYWVALAQHYFGAV